MEHGADPVDVGGQRVVFEREPLRRFSRLQIHQARGVRLARVAAIARRLKHDRAGGQHDQHGDGGGACRHLKSRREKMSADAISRMAMYIAAYPAFIATRPAATSCPCTAIAFTSKAAKFGSA